MAARLTVKALAALAGVAAAAASPLEATLATRAARQASLQAAFAAVATWTPSETPQASSRCPLGARGECGEGDLFRDLFVDDYHGLDSLIAANATAWQEADPADKVLAPAVSAAAADAGWGLGLMGSDSLENKSMEGSGGDGPKRLRPVSFTLREHHDGRTLGALRLLSWLRLGAAPLPSPAVD